MMHNKLFASVSMTALAAAATNATPAMADMDSGYTLSLKGGVSAGNSIWAEKIGSSGFGPSSGSYDFSISDTNGSFGAISLTKDINSSFDIGIGASLARGGASNMSGYYSSFSEWSSNSYDYDSGNYNEFSVDALFEFETLDFEIGYNLPATGNTEIRLFAGARNLKTSSRFNGYFDGSHYRDKIGYDDNAGHYSYSSGSSFGTYAMNFGFNGWGPRIGAEFSTRIPNSKLGLSGSVGMSQFNGSLDKSGQVSGYSSWYEKSNSSGSYNYSSSGAPFSSNFESSFTLPEKIQGLDLEIGVDYYISDNSSIGIGYTLQQFWNVDIESLESGEPRVVQGVYLGFETSF